MNHGRTMVQSPWLTNDYGLTMAIEPWFIYHGRPPRCKKSFNEQILTSKTNNDKNLKLCLCNDYGIDVAVPFFCTTELSVCVTCSTVRQPWFNHGQSIVNEPFNQSQTTHVFSLFTAVTLTLAP